MSSLFVAAAATRCALRPGIALDTCTGFFSCLFQNLGNNTHPFDVVSQEKVVDAHENQTTRNQRGTAVAIWLRGHLSMRL